MRAVYRDRDHIGGGWQEVRVVRGDAVSSVSNLFGCPWPRSRRGVAAMAVLLTLAAAAERSAPDAEARSDPESIMRRVEGGWGGRGLRD